MNKETFARLFPLGTHLCREPMPSMAEMKRDLENVKRHGFNLIKLQEQWMIDEPLEGHYDFSRYEELIDYCARLDLGVYLGLTCEQAPNWLWRKYPDARMVRRDGLSVSYIAQSPLPGDGKPGPCYDHPGAMADQVRFIKQLVKTLGRYENIVIWNTWQEVGYAQPRLPGDYVCFCEHTLEHWRRWLAAKYGDLDGLNRAWNSRYLDWSYVIPDRIPMGRQGLPQDVDWYYFMDNVQIGDILRARAQAIREADPLARPVFCHKSAPLIGSGMDWTYARCQDFMGSSCYPARWLEKWDSGRPVIGHPFDRAKALEEEMWNMVALRYDYVRCFNRRGAPVWAAEFQGGPQSTGTHKGRVPSREDIRRWMLTAVGSGITALAFWTTRAEIMAQEVNGYALLDSEGDTTPRYEEAARIGQALNRHTELFAQPTRPTSEVAILINEENHQFSQSTTQGGEHHAYSVRGWYRLLWQAGIPVDFVEISGLDEADLQQYKALILPYPVALGEKIASRLAAYVEKGGSLISEAAAGRFDEHAFANRGELSPTIKALAGVRQTSYTIVREPGHGARWTPEERSWGEFLDAAMLGGVGQLANHQVRANVHIETYECLGAEPCLKYGEQVAGVTRAVGQGRIWLLGTFIGHNGTGYPDEASSAFAVALLARCGVGPAHAGKLLLRKRITPDKEAWLYTNPTGEEVTEAVDVTGWTKVEDLLGTPVMRSGNQVQLSVGGLDVRVLLVSRM